MLNFSLETSRGNEIKPHLHWMAINNLFIQIFHTHTKLDYFFSGKGKINLSKTKGEQWQNRTICFPHFYYTFSGVYILGGNVEMRKCDVVSGYLNTIKSVIK